MNKNIWIPKFNYYSKRLSMWQEKLWREVNGKPFMGILDNVAGRKTFEYATFGRSGVQQSNSKLLTIRSQPVNIQKMTAACVWNASNAIPKDSGLTTQIDRGSYEYDADSTGGYFVYGYAVSGEAYHSTYNFGTIDNDTYNDGGGTSRTIKGLYHHDLGGSQSDDMAFSLDGTSISNSDTTWLDITWDDTATVARTVTRATDLVTYTLSLNGSTHWRDLAAPFSWADTDANTDLVITTS